MMERAHTRGSRLVGVVIALALTAAACGSTSPTPEASDRTTEPPSEPAPEITVEPTPVALPLPPEGEIEVGVPYEFDLLTHCGVEFMRFDGRIWSTEALGGPNAPKGFDNPEQPGIVTLESADRAVFVGGPEGTELVFTPTAEEPPLCA
ncbi:MAG: hypothetical protein M5U31_08555 [Acidimicrobiia bacterium]|nr:hypothetical protein [Acidimicrobiia bacterium]